MHNTGYTIHCNKLPWLPLAPKVFVRIIKLDPQTGEHTIMVRAEPGGLLPRHRHEDSAEIYVLKGGGAHPQTGSFVAGDYVSEIKGAVHDPLPFECETELLMVSRGASVFLADDGSDLYVMDVDMLQRLAGGAIATASIYYTSDVNFIPLPPSDPIFHSRYMDLNPTIHDLHTKKVAFSDIDPTLLQDEKLLARYCGIFAGNGIVRVFGSRNRNSEVVEKSSDTIIIRGDTVANKGFRDLDGILERSRLTSTLNNR
ncbi:RmlC-like cupin domain-containing protein [Aspergillus avenaceus]|uniref:RmlC-like cupin domain-containing protein n=1 Tax=Aspergillus avenaceus TaxID=36643 RepID=A0A5N6U3N5_ASPAV|nr:RmlC-like cupin domain-containing protein [Aspergillus avenaceus]